MDIRCEHFGVCGGCKAQNVSYDEQLEYKENFVRELFGSVDPIIGCEDPWNWRNKMEFSFSQNKAGDQFLGLMMKGGRGKVVTLNQCHIAAEWMAEVLQDVQAWWSTTSLNAYFPPRDLGTLRNLTMRNGVYTDQKMVVLTISGHPDFQMSQKEIDSFAYAVDVDSLILRTQHIKKGTPTYFTEQVLKGKDHITEQLHDANGKAYTFKIRAASFFQPNTLQAEKLYQVATEGLESEKTLLDLYCGTATIGIFSSSKAEKVIGIESVKEATLDALDNCQNNQINNVEVFNATVEEKLHELPQASTVIVDPPRAGLSKKALNPLLELRPKKIIYISCNPVSQKKNIDELEGYEVSRVQPLDQFPHTTHLENIVFLESIS